MGFFRILWNFRSTLFLVLLPIVLLPIPIVLDKGDQKVAACGYCIIIMASYWISEVIPLAVTAFLPLILFPLMGIMSASAVSIVYLKDTNWLFIGGLIIAVAVEHTNLHKRIALSVLLLVGSKPHSLMIGFMLPTWFLSMWISNTATTAMMIPIVSAVLGQMKSEEIDYGFQETEDGEIRLESVKEEMGGTSFHNIYADTADDDGTQDDGIESIPAEEYFPKKNDDWDSVSQKSCNSKRSNDEKLSAAEQQQNGGSSKLEKGLTVCVPYAASIGGIATLTGTGPNLVLAGQYEILFPDAEPPITFSNWIAYHLPLSLTLLLSCYVWLMFLYLGLDRKTIRSWCSRGGKSEYEKKVQKVLKKEYGKLGDIKWAEITTIIILSSTVFLWFFRDPGFIPGWSIIFNDDYVSDATVAMTMATLLFLLPSRRPTFLGKRPDDPNDIKPVPSILNWPTVQRMLPWNVVFLLGGGFALAEGATQSGFSEWLGNQLAFLDGIPDWTICLVVTIITCLFTECTSNVATASLFIPIIAQLAQVVGIHPYYLLEPATVATSLAFMLPVATPPNAIAFSYGHLKVLDLVKSGWLLNVLGVLFLMLFINTYAVTLFGVDEFPEWAELNYTSPTAEALIL